MRLVPKLLDSTLRPKSMNQNSKLIKELYLRNDDDFQNGDVHQAILNIMYDIWNQQSVWRSYKTMTSWFRSEYGDLAAFAVLIGKYNQQVCNGGHHQYLNNGYAGSQAGESDIHEKMIELFLKLKYEESKIGSAMINILYDFKIEEVDDEEYSGYAFFEVSCAEELDSRYYDINDRWIEFLNKDFSEKLSVEAQDDRAS